MTTRRSGTHIHYRLSSDRVYDLLAALRDVAAGHLDGLDAVARDYLGDRTGLEAVTREGLRHRLDRGEVTMLDGRPHPDFETGHIPSAISGPPSELDHVLGQLGDDRAVAAYCRGPYCVYADQSVVALRRNGRTADRLEDGFPEMGARWRRGHPQPARRPSARATARPRRSTTLVKRIKRVAFRITNGRTGASACCSLRALPTGRRWPPSACPRLARR